VSPDPFELAVEALGRKERTCAELVQWLGARVVAAEEVEAVVERLVEVGELDDERFARRYAEDKRELRGWGAARIEQALLARGVAPDIVQAVMNDDPQSAQVRRATGLLARRGERLDSDAARGRALAYLTRRGYSYEVAYDAVRQHVHAN
jgi:regulatory protein